MNTTLLIMAAGLGSRYGGNKQIDRIGPNGEILMEYSIHDAIEAGFDKVVFVIRKSMEELPFVFYGISTTFDLRSKVGCTSKIKINSNLFCFLLGLHYLCTRNIS